MAAKVTDTFPVHRVPLGPLSVPVPKCPARILAQYYGSGWRKPCGAVRSSGRTHNLTAGEIQTWHGVPRKEVSARALSKFAS